MKHLFILSILMLAAGCQSVGHHAEQTDESVMDTTIQNPQQLERIDPHAKLNLKFHNKNKTKWTDMELWFDKIYYQDTIHIFDNLESWQYEMDGAYQIWCNGTHTAIVLPIYVGYFKYSLNLFFKGTDLCRIDTTDIYIEFLNDIDEDGCVEFGCIDFEDDSGQGLFLEEDSITYSMYNTKHYVYKYSGNNLYLDPDLSAKVHNLLIVQRKDTVIEAWGNKMVSPYEYRNYIDLNKSTLADYGVK